jgi:glycine cleavage system H lipoate-binding protein
MPVTGEIIEVNEALRADPASLHSTCWRWLVLQGHSSTPVPLTP